MVLQVDSGEFGFGDAEDARRRTSDREYLESLGAFFHQAADWSHYGTFTSKRKHSRYNHEKRRFDYEVEYDADVPLALLLRNFKRWARWMERTSGCRLDWILVSEVGSAGRRHLHALIANMEHLDAGLMEQAWKRNFGRATIVPYDAARGAAYYVCKDLHTESAYWELSLKLGHPTKPPIIWARPEPDVEHVEFS